MPFFIRCLKPSIQGLCILCIGFLLAISPLAKAEEVKILKSMSSIDDQRFPMVLLRKVLEKGGGYKITYPDDDKGRIGSSDQKLRNDVLNGDKDIFWTLSNPTLEDQFQAIYIPIYRGLLGMRIAIIKQENHDILKHVNSLDDLRHLKAGQGAMWSDVKILQHNQVPVVKEVKYDNLFPMLEGGRFDYFPRGLPEPWAEIKTYAKYNLSVDKHILLKYTAPFYYFVNKNNKQLINYLNKHLMAMIDSGEYEKLFFAHPEMRAALSRSELSKRKVIELNNPNLTEKTPLDNAKLWFDPASTQTTKPAF